MCKCKGSREKLEPQLLQIRSWHYDAALPSARVGCAGFEPEFHSQCCRIRIHASEFHSQCCRITVASSRADQRMLGGDEGVGGDEVLGGDDGYNVFFFILVEVTTS